MRVLALIPARGGSKGLPGKNIRPFAGRPLIQHSIECAKMVYEIQESGLILVSTDSEEIIAHAVAAGARATMRPWVLASDESPVWETVRHTILTADGQGEGFDYLVLLEPTSPIRRPEWISEGLKLLDAHPTADGLHGCSLTEHNPIWNAFLVAERTGYLKYLIPEGRFFHHRQDMPKTYKQDGSFHIWRTQFIRDREGGYHWGDHIMFETDPLWAFSIDTLEEFERAEGIVTSGMIKLPWEE